MPTPLARARPHRALAAPFEAVATAGRVFNQSYKLFFFIFLINITAFGLSKTTNFQDERKLTRAQSEGGSAK